MHIVAVHEGVYNAELFLNNLLHSELSHFSTYANIK